VLGRTVRIGDLVDAGALEGKTNWREVTQAISEAAYGHPSYADTIAMHSFQFDLVFGAELIPLADQKIYLPVIDEGTPVERNSIIRGPGKYYTAAPEREEYLRQQIAGLEGPPESYNFGDLSSATTLEDVEEVLPHRSNISVALRAQIDVAQKEHPKGTTVVVFRREPEDPEFPGASLKQSRRWKIENLISLTVRQSLFEGARAVEMKWPLDLNDAPHQNLYGNSVVVLNEGNLIFSGILVQPKIESKKGQTITWVAQSHTYTFIKTHFNPTSFKLGWDQMTPLAVVSQLSHLFVQPFSLDETAKELLAVPYADSDGLEHINSDIAGTTPFKFAEKLISAAGMYVHCRADSVLSVRKVNPRGDAVATLRQGDNVEFNVKYNYGDLARTYSVLSQKRDAEDIQMAEMPEFPLPIFRNRVRTTGLGGALDVANSWGAGVAVYELSKSLAEAVNIQVIVPEWEVPETNRLWEVGDRVELDAPIYGLVGAEGPLQAVVSGITLTHTKVQKKAALSLSLPGVFDVRLPQVLPFLLGPEQDVGFRSVSLTESGGDSES